MIDHARVREVKSATVGLLQNLWMQNYKNNQAKIRNGYKVASLYDRFGSVPAVLVGAGPSIDRNMALLSCVIGKAIIIASDTIYHGLVGAGIIPDLVITLDPQPNIKRFFTGVSTSRQILVAPTIISPEALDAWRGDVVFYNKYAPDIPFLNQISTQNSTVGTLVPGGSVLTVALDLAFRMGANPISFIGQNLSYPSGGSTHSAATIYSDIGVEHIRREKGDNLVTETDIFGRSVLTEKNMSVSKQWMEWAFVNLKRKNQATFYNCSEAGIVTNGCSVVSFAEWIARYCGPTTRKRNFGWEIKKAIAKR